MRIGRNLFDKILFYVSEATFIFSFPYFLYFLIFQPVIDSVSIFTFPKLLLFFITLLSAVILLSIIQKRRTLFETQDVIRIISETGIYSTFIQINGVTREYVYLLNGEVDKLSVGVAYLVVLILLFMLSVITRFLFRSGKQNQNPGKSTTIIKHTVISVLYLGGNLLFVDLIIMIIATGLGNDLTESQSMINPDNIQSLLTTAFLFFGLPLRISFGDRTQPVVQKITTIRRWVLFIVHSLNVLAVIFAKNYSVIDSTLEPFALYSLIYEIPVIFYFGFKIIKGKALH